MSEPRGRRWPGALPGLSLWVLGFILMGGAVLSPATRFAGSDWLDAHGTLWFYWWTGAHSGLDQALTHSTWLFHPWGKDLYLHSGGNQLDALMVQPLRWLFGDTLAWNLWVAGVLASNAWVGGHLARVAGGQRWSQWLGSLLCLTAPFCLWELEQGRPTQALLLFPCLWLASLMRPPSVASTVSGGVWLALAGLQYWYFGLVGGVLGGILVLARLPYVHAKGRHVAGVVAAGGLAFCLVLPVMWPMVGALADGAVPGLLAVVQDGTGHVGKLRFETAEGEAQGLFVLDALGRIVGIGWEEGLRLQPGPVLVSLGALATVGLALWRQRTVGLPVVLTAAAMVGMAAGPVVVVGSQVLAHLPWQWAMEGFEPLRRWWWPVRAMVFLAPLAALCGVALEGLVARRRRWATGALAVVILGQSATLGPGPLSAWEGVHSPVLDCLAAAPRATVLSLPVRADQRHLYLQTIHQQPMLNGMLVTKRAFVPDELERIWGRNTWFRLLKRWGEGQFSGSREYEAMDRSELRALGLRYVLFDRSSFRRDRVWGDGHSRSQDRWDKGRRVVDRVIGLPTAEDEGFALYDLDGSLDCPAG